MDELMMGLIYVEGINVALSVVLVVLYYQNYRALRSAAGLGLLVFSLVFLVQNGAGLYLHYTTGEFYAKMLATHAFVLELVETLALAALAYTGWKE